MALPDAPLPLLPKIGPSSRAVFNPTLHSANAETRDVSVGGRLIVV